MGLPKSGDAASRFSAYVEGLASVIGHADRAGQRFEQAFLRSAKDTRTQRMGASRVRAMFFLKSANGKGVVSPVPGRCLRKSLCFHEHDTLRRKRF